MFEVTIVISQQFETRSQANDFAHGLINSITANPAHDFASVNTTIDKVQAEGASHAD